jgi:hypothetical protein
MAMLLVLLFPALAFGMVIAFIIAFRKGVKDGIYQKGTFTKTFFRRK